MPATASHDVVRRLMARLKMRHLRLLLHISEHGSLTRVAEHMATSQPAVTSALAELENMFGVALFTRSARGMTPTPAGQIALARARAMLHDLDHLVSDMDAIASGHAAHLHIGVLPFVAGKMVSEAIQHTLALGYRLTVKVDEGTSGQLLPRLRDHALDLVIGRVSASLDMDNIDFEVLYQQRPRLIASRRLAARLGRHRLDWPMLAELDWILGAPRTPMREQIVELFLRAGVRPPTPIVESYSSKLIGELIVGSDSVVSIVPAEIAEELVRIAGVSIVPYSFDWTLSPVTLFTRTGGLQRDVDTAFKTALRVVCQGANFKMSI